MKSSKRKSGTVAAAPPPPETVVPSAPVPAGTVITLSSNGTVRDAAAMRTKLLEVLEAVSVTLDAHAVARIDTAMMQVLVAFVRREGIWLAAGVMVADVAANWIGNWPSLRQDPARLLRPVGLLPITPFGVFVLVTALPLPRVVKDRAP